MRTLAAISLAFLSSCNPFKIHLNPVQLEPIAVNIRMDVYQHSTDKTGDAKKDEADVKAARERIYNRQQQLQEIKNNRWVAETHRGELQVREKPAGDTGKWVEKTVNEENEDRKILMRARSRELDIDLHDVQDQFWKDNIQKAYAGEWIEIKDPARSGLFKLVQKEAKP